MSITPDTKRHLEGILGHELTDEAVERISLLQDIASSNTIFLDAFTTTRSLLVAKPNRCRQATLFEVSGVATTGNDGKVKFHLNDFLCPPTVKFGFPINVVATPFSTTPFFLTVIHNLVGGGVDVEIQVASWSPGGTAAPNVTFDWRCRVELPLNVM